MAEKSKYYDQVAQELKAGDIKEALWAEAMAKSGGNDSRAKSIYINLRIRQLQAESWAYSDMKNNRNLYLSLWGVSLVVSAISYKYHLSLLGWSGLVFFLAFCNFFSIGMRRTLSYSIPKISIVILSWLTGFIGLLLFAIIDSKISNAIRSHKKGSRSKSYLSPYCYWSLLLALPMPYLGLPISILAIRDVSRNGNKKGKMLAWIGLTLNTLMLLFFIAVYDFSRTR